MEGNGFIESGNGNRRIPLLICASNLVGMVSYLALSIWVYQETNSYILSSIIFGCQWILPLVWPTGIARLTEKADLRKLASRSEWTSAILSLALIGAVAFKIFPLVFVFVMIRGFCDSLTRTAASLIVKFSETDLKLVERGITRIEFLRVVGTSAAGIVFSILGNHNTILMFLVYSVVVLIITGGFFRSLKPIETTASNSDNSKIGDFAKLRKALTTQPSAAKWLWLLAIVAAFQGVHNAIRVAYPDQQLGQGVAGVGIISTVSTVGILIGGWIVNSNRVSQTLKLSPGWLLVTVVGLTGSVAVFIPVVVPSYAFYFVFMILFEITFMVFNMNLVTSTDKINISAILGFRTTILNASTLFGLVITSVFLVKFSASWSTLLTASLLVVSSILLSYKYKQKQR